MGTKINYNEQECPLCNEYLSFNKKGVMTNKNTGEIIYVFNCEECNQSFALDNDDELKFIPYDAEMKLIENKCKVCDTIENYNEKGLFLLNKDTAHYEFYCFDCAIPVLQEWVDKNCKKKLKVDMKNIQDVYNVYDFNKNQEMLEEMQNSPNKFKKLKERFEKQLKRSDNTAKDGN